MKIVSHGFELAMIDASGVRHDNVRPVRLFPLTDPQHWISLVNADGRELACIPDLAALDDEQRGLINSALARRDFVPLIRRIMKIHREAGGHVWHVETDRGTTAFRIETDESIQSLGNGRIVIIDTLGTRYLVANVNELDKDSRRRLERYY